MFDTSKRKPDYPLLTAVGILVPLGLVMVYSASFVDAFNQHGNQLYYTLRQLSGVVLGTIGLLVAQRIDYRFWRTYSVQLIGAALLLLLVVLVLPTDLTEVNNARSWIRLGFFSMQPSEVAKLAMIVYFADWLSRRGERLDNVSYGLIPFAMMLGIVCGLVMLEGDLGTTIVMIVIGGLVYFTAGANLLHILAAAAVSGGAFWAMIKIAPFRQGRIAAWLDPFSDYLGAGWQPVHGLYALGSGGIFGVGLGQGRQKFIWLSQAHTDAIFAVIGEEFGLIGTLFVVGCFLVIAYRGLRIAGRAPEPFAALLATGLTGWLVFQALINMAVVTTLLPFTGLTLPFISYGSSSLIMCMVATGILLSISRHTVERPREAPEQALRASRRPPIALRERLAGWWRPARGSAGGRRGAREVPGIPRRSARRPR
ncbi:MAG TPA: putative lipid II flippase FtsW [Kouleothrix sp.]|uniref:putative lipid II flippase FtsW n=1 Tax=Kouleothrix sp. TaxID=2779161 RepID=UPI002C791F8F|nr:putative lipid II flippase FtsW [Kouleothrix sp.]HRC76118.1 putative lipid II flippase FtsW [Kouleothrix sp.]